MNIKKIMSELTLDEKLTLLIGNDCWHTVEIEHADVPSITVSDGPHGVRKVYQGSDETEHTYNAVGFPTASALSATWNRKLVYEVGEALAEECAYLNVDILLGPGTNIKRTPLCGRNFEYFSEDPLLAGELAAAYINGVQSKEVGTSLKHFAANNQEFDRFNISSEADERTLREIYLKPFEIAVKKARPWTVMCSYNRLNGVYSSENKYLLDDILRKEWGFEGIVISDWDAVHERSKSLKASLELQMPFKDTAFNELKTAYQNKLITDEDIDAAVERLLNIVKKAVDSRNKRTKVNNFDLHVKLAKEAALEAITLLKNEQNILPIDKKKIKKIAVIGNKAKEPSIQGGGSSMVNPTEVLKPLDSIMDLAGSDIEINYADAYINNEEVKELDKAMEIAGEADMAIVFAGDSSQIETEGYDRSGISLHPCMENMITRISSQNPNTVVVIQAGAAIDMSAWINKVKAVVFAWFTGQTGGSAIADILFGKVNPSGKLAETFPLRIEDTPAHPSYPGNGFASEYKEGIMVGYRYYDTYEKEVLYPFGYGLSYTTFEYQDLRISPETAEEDENVRVSFKIKNTGSREGKETVQLYIKDKVCRVIRPEKELKAFEKISLAAGEEKEVQFILSREAFAYYNTSLHKWNVESGIFEVMIGASSRDIRLNGRVKIKAKYDFS